MIVLNLAVANHISGLTLHLRHPLANPGTTFAFPLLFAVFLFIGYVMLYALTHLQPARPSGEPLDLARDRFRVRIAE